MKNLGDIYLRAMKLVETGEEDYSCSAIAEIEGTHRGGLFYYTGPANKLYRTTMGLETWYAISKVEFAANKIGISPKDFRVMLLGMMAACWRDMVPWRKCK